MDNNNEKILQNTICPRLIYVLYSIPLAFPTRNRSRSHSCLNEQYLLGGHMTLDQLEDDGFIESQSCPLLFIYGMSFILTVKFNVAIFSENPC